MPFDPTWFAGLLRSVLVEPLPFRIVHDYELGLRYKAGNPQEGILTHENGMRAILPLMTAAVNPASYTVSPGEKRKWNLQFKLKETPRGGVHWYVPLRDEINVESIAWNVHEVAIQDLMTSDGHPLTAKGTAKYRLVDIRKYWSTLQSQEEAIEETIVGIIANELRSRSKAKILMASQISARELFDEQGEKKKLNRREGKQEMSPLEREISDLLDNEVRDYGFEVDRVYLPTLTFPSTYRVVGLDRYEGNGIKNGSE